MERSHKARRRSPRSARGPSAEARKAGGKRARVAYCLKLYVTGLTPGSSQAIERVRALCEEHLQGSYLLEVIDIYQKPSLARDEQIVATPTLIRVLPPPLRRYIGNLANVDRVLFGLDLRPVRA